MSVGPAIEPKVSILVLSNNEDDRDRADDYCAAIFERLPEHTGDHLFSAKRYGEGTLPAFHPYHMVVIHLSNSRSDFREISAWLDEWSQMFQSDQRLGIICAIDAEELNEAMKQWKEITSAVAGKTGIDFFWHYIPGEPDDFGIVDSAVRWVRRNVRS